MAPISSLKKQSFQGNLVWAEAFVPNFNGRGQAEDFCQSAQLNGRICSRNFRSFKESELRPLLFQAKNGSAKKNVLHPLFFGKTIVPNSFQNISVGFIKYVQMVQIICLFSWEIFEVKRVSKASNRSWCLRN